MTIKKGNHSQKYWKTIVYTMALGWVVIWLYRTALAPVYPEISHYFGGASDSQIGSISSLYFLGYVLMQIPSGMLVDRLGQKNVLIPGFLLFGIGTLIVSLAPTLTFVYVGSVVAGVGCGTFYGVAYSLTGKYVPSGKKSLATAFVNCGTAVGSGAGMILSSYLVSQLGLPWQTMLFGVLGLIVLMVVVFIKFIRQEEKIEAHPLKKIEEATSTFSIKQVFTPKLLTAYVLYFSTCYAYYLTDTWLPNYLSTERGFEGATIGLASSMVFFTAVPGALLFSRIADKYVEHKINLIICLELLAAVSLFIAISSNSVSVLMLGLMLYGFFGKITVEPLIISWLGESIPRKGLATTLGFFNFFGMSSSVIVPSLTGFISDATGSKVSSFYLAICIIVIGSLPFYFFNRTKKIERAL